MSQIHVKSPKHCGNKDPLTSRYKFNRKKLYLYLSTIFLTLLAFILLVWLILHPSKPQFSLAQAVVTQLNLSSSPSPILNSTLQLTLRSTNPNTRIGIYYDDLLLYASYKGQRITPDTAVSPFYQGHQETTLLGAWLAGTQQPVSPSFEYEVRRDTAAGRMVVGFKGIGRLRWKVGSWVSGRYRFMVDCVAVMPFGGMPSPPLSSRQGSVCSTAV